MNQKILLIVLISILTSCKDPSVYFDKKNLDLSHYTYKKTKLVLESLHKGAFLLENRGYGALKEYEKKLSNHEIYFYVYRINDCMCLYHGEDSTRINKSVENQNDYMGKPIHDLICDALEDKEDNPHAWVHFNWPKSGDIFPSWKSSAHKKLKLKNGDEVYIGTGMFGYYSESEFIHISVKKACRLINEYGDSILSYLQAPESPFFFFDCSIFIYDFKGNPIIDPSHKKGSKINMIGFEDATGHKPFEAIARILRNNTEAVNTLQYYISGSMNLRKKIIYCRKTMLNNKWVIVGSMIDAPKAVWFK